MTFVVLNNYSNRKMFGLCTGTDNIWPFITNILWSNIWLRLRYRLLWIFLVILQDFHLLLPILTPVRWSKLVDYYLLLRDTRFVAPFDRLNWIDSNFEIFRGLNVAEKFIRMHGRWALRKKEVDYKTGSFVIWQKTLVARFPVINKRMYFQR